MYTVTFYSFKGGVGRTMAMVNTALALAQTGRRVLLIDFDLEAPGLTTFDRLRSHGPRPGIVEFVNDYLRTGDAPDLENYVYEAPASDGSGRVSVLPAGREDSAYRRTLAQINWLDLYSHKDGFLLFEDLKYQIESKFNPDYVLIDSRTGHSDIEGICTRHLPDAVVVLFFPNEQNLSGLDSVCRNIRAEKNTGLCKDITLHFVMSNVPDLDDEDDILRGRIHEFRRRLGFKKLSATIHHYNSLTLLNQSVFVLDRPASRLAKQYKKLVDEIVKSNISDRTGVLEYLRDVRASEYLSPSTNRGVTWLQTTEDRVRSIADKFSDDVGVQFAAATAFETLGHVEESVNRLDKILEEAPDFVEARIERASCRAMLGETKGAISDLMESFRPGQIGERQVISAVRLLSSLDIAKISEPVVSSAVTSLSPKAKFILAGDAMLNARAWELPDVRSTLVNILKDAFQDDESDNSLVKTNLTLLLIHEGRWDEAIAIVAPTGEPGPAIEDVFNYAMAKWGRDGLLPGELMEWVSRKIPDIERGTDANFYQCAAVAAWAAGRNSEAINYLETAIRMAPDVARTVFSCWRYAFVVPEQFLIDCEAIRRMVEGVPSVPQFIEEASSKTG